MYKNNKRFLLKWQ